MNDLDLREEMDLLAKAIIDDTKKAECKAIDRIEAFKILKSWYETVTKPAKGKPNGRADDDDERPPVGDMNAIRAGIDKAAHSRN